MAAWGIADVVAGDACSGNESTRRLCSHELEQRDRGALLLLSSAPLLSLPVAQIARRLSNLRPAAPDKQVALAPAFDSRLRTVFVRRSRRLVRRAHEVPGLFAAFCGFARVSASRRRVAGRSPRRSLPGMSRAAEWAARVEEWRASGLGRKSSASRRSTRRRVCCTGRASCVERASSHAARQARCACACGRTPIACRCGAAGADHRAVRNACSWRCARVRTRHARRGVRGARAGARHDPRRCGDLRGARAHRPSAWASIGSRAWCRNRSAESRAAARCSCSSASARLRSRCCSSTARACACSTSAPTAALSGPRAVASPRRRASS